MILNRKTILVLAAGCALTAAAQNVSRSAYFMDGNTWRHALNPAFSGEYNYVSVPCLGVFNVSINSNAGVSTFLFKTPAGSPYKLTTFMSPTVDAGRFLGGLPNTTLLSTSIDEALLSGGFRALGGFNTVSFGIHGDLGLSLPKDLFKFMKVGQTGPDTRYDLSDLRFNATSYTTLALGHSRKIGDKLSVGAKVKFLFGLENITANMRKMNVVMDQNKWQIQADGELKMAAGSGLKVPTKAETGADYDTPADADLIDWDNIKYNSFGLTGFGMGFDLGVTYQVLPDLQLSAAVRDLGFMCWSNGVVARTGTGEWTFDGFQNVAVNDKQPGYNDGPESNKIDKQLDRVWDDLQDVISMHREANDGYSTPLNATIHLGAEYTMPFYRGLSGGFLFSTYIAGCQSWTEGRFYANIKPVKWFDATINYGASTFGNSMGWMLNFHPRGFNFFIGSDHQFFRLTSWGIPVDNFNGTVSLGFNVTF